MNGSTIVYYVSECSKVFTYILDLCFSSDHYFKMVSVFYAGLIFGIFITYFKYDFNINGRKKPIFSHYYQYVTAM